jgi:hypothetical protein
MVAFDGEPWLRITGLKEEIDAGLSVIPASLLDSRTSVAAPLDEETSTG